MASATLVPLESNPEIMTKFIRKLGVPDKWAISDVMGLECDMLLWVPRPVLALTLLFPISQTYEQHKEKEESDILAKGQVVSNNLFYMKQNISNACGTVALVHAVANNLHEIELGDGCLKSFLEEAKNKDATERGKLLEKCEGIIQAHTELAQEGQTNTPNAEDPINHHFITFVHKDGDLYELDGRKAFPINHGPCDSDLLLEEAAKACQEFMARDPQEVRFTVVALTMADDDD